MRIIIFLTLCCLNLFAIDSLVVDLPLQTPVAPVYIAPFDIKDSSLKKQHIDDLYEAFLYDMKMSGRCRIVSSNTQIDQTLKKGTTKEAFHPSTWKHLGISYVLQPKIHKDKLTLSLYSIETCLLTPFNEIALTGERKIDKKRIHKLSDATIKKMFHVEGIASNPIYFASKSLESKKWLSDIYQIDPDGDFCEPLITDNAYLISPVTLQNKLYYVSYKTGQPKIYQANGGAVIELRGNQLLPAFSPRGNKIAFISDAVGRADLFIQDFDPIHGAKGKPVQLYSLPRTVQSSPTFGPNGQLAFVSDKDLTPRIYLMDLNMTQPGGKLPNVKCLTTKNRENTAPSWSPDGSKLAYSSKTGGTRQIWIYDFETEEEIQLTRGPGHKENPSWASDSFHIVYNTTSPNSDLYVIHLNTQEGIKITNNIGIKHYPHWSQNEKN